MRSRRLRRQCFPKRADLSVHTAADLRAVGDRLGNWPRKTLGWRTLAGIIAASMP